MVALHFLEVLHKRSGKMRLKMNLQQNTLCLEQQIYASQENFTHTLVMMVETFRRPGQDRTINPSRHSRVII